MFYVLLFLFSFFSGSVVKNLPAMQKPQEIGEFDPWVRKIFWRKKWQPTPGFFLENPMDRGAWWVTVHGVAKSQTQLKRQTGLISLLSKGLSRVLQHHNSKASVLWCMVQLSHPYMTPGKTIDLTTAKCSQILL